jgi:hypothetical protein
VASATPRLSPQGLFPFGREEVRPVRWAQHYVLCWQVGKDRQIFVCPFSAAIELGEEREMGKKEESFSLSFSSVFLSSSG